MSIADMIKKKLEQEKEKEKKKVDKKEKPLKEEKEQSTDIAESVISVGNISIKISHPKRVPFVKKRYNGRETISASIPGWLKASLDYLASTIPRYRGFGGKSKFLAEAIEEKLKNEFPELYKELKKLKAFD